MARTDLLIKALLLAVLLAGGTAAARVRTVKPHAARPTRAMIAAAKRTLIVVYKPGAASDANVAAASAALQGGSLAATRVGPLVRIGDDFAAHAVELAPGASAAANAALALAQLLPSSASAPAAADAAASIAADSPLRAEAARLRDLGIDYIEADQVMSAAFTQTGATWGLDRVDQPSLPLDSTFSYYNSSGAGTRIYVVDTGISITHVDFGGRAVWGTSYTGVNTDDNGHGTLVAGVAGGATYGVAKAATLVAVKVLDSTGSGTTTNIINGISWAVSNCKAQPAPRRCVINISITGPKSSALNSAVASAYTNGMIAVVAAGNGATGGADACNYSPASELSAITVYATDSTDALASWSYWGKCTDIGAPGVSITSDYNNPANSAGITSGTSMSSPHVAGAAALLWGEFPSRNNTQVISGLLRQASAGKVALSSAAVTAGTPNKLLFTSLPSI